MVISRLMGLYGSRNRFVFKLCYDIDLVELTRCSSNTEVDFELFKIATRLYMAFMILICIGILVKATNALS